jgi:hypothetical protein
VNVIVNVALWPGFSVKGAVTPDAVKSDPAMEMPEIVTGAVPVEVKTTGCEAVCPTVTLPKLMVVVLRPSVGAPATPDALIFTTAVGLVDELLVIVRTPVNVLTWGDVNVIVNVAVWPEFSVKGAATPDSVNSEPATEMAEMVTGAVPVEVKVTVLEAVCPTATLPKAKLFVLRTSDGVLCASNANGKQQITTASRAMRVLLSLKARLNEVESNPLNLLADKERTLSLLSPESLVTHSTFSVRAMSLCAPI